MEAHGRGTVIDILTAALARPAIDADTAVAAQCVEAGAPVVASVGLQLTFIHILRAELACGTHTHLSSHPTHAHPTPTTWLLSALGLTCPFRRALAIVGVDAIHTRAAIETSVPWTVVHIHFTVLALEP